ncbi:MAG: hypothetical protein Q9187_003141 [Circinaria calcarea]
MAKKDKKSKTAEQKARVAAKQTKKATQKERKVKSKGGKEDSDADDVDLESVLEEYAKQQALYLKVTETVSEPPSPRSSSTLIGSPSNSNELFLFGGEYYNGALATFFNDLYVYLIDRGEWRKISSSNSPLNRSGHAWCRGGNAGGVNFHLRNKGKLVLVNDRCHGKPLMNGSRTFYHYNDFWRLEPSTREWTRIETKGKGPPARSGHRMTYYKNYILLFGGFQDTSEQTKYLQDLWIYDCQNYVWHNATLPPATQKPDPRSSFSFLPHDSGAVIYGGYSRVKSTTTAGKQTKGGQQGLRSVLKPMVHQDTWFLRIMQPGPDALASTPPTIRWERRKKPANPPNPPRAGAKMAYHKGRGILFGGVHDVEESEEGIESEFFDNLFVWNIERNRFFQLTLRRPRGPNKKALAERGGAKRGRGKADEEDLLRNLAALETKGSFADPNIMDIDIVKEEVVEPVKSIHPILMTMPHPRFNAQLTVQDDVLYIFGGTYERGDREFTFDELWAIDLGKLDGVREIYRRELENWHGDDNEDSDSAEDEDSTDSEDEDMDGGSSSGVPLPREQSEPMTSSAEMVSSQQIAEVEEEQPESALSDNRPHPRPFESLRDFFTRTSNDWQEILLQILRLSDSTANQAVKEIRKKAFDMAEAKWWDCREEITALEDQQEEAGIGEVVSMSERGGESGGGGRRR